MHRIATVGLAIGLAATLGACRAELARDLSAPAAEELLVALDGAGIAAEREPGASGTDRFEVWVQRSDLVPAMALMRQEGLPRREPEDRAGEGLIPSVAEERRRHDAAVAEALRRSLEDLQGVHRARVHIAHDPRARPLDDADAVPRASVLILQRGEAPDERAVRALVAGAVAGLSPEAVELVVQAAPASPTRDARYVFVGPLAVSPESAGPLRGALATALGLNLVLAGALVMQRRRART